MLAATNAAEASINSSLKSPAMRFVLSSLVFHGALRIPAKRLSICVGKYAQNLPRSPRARSGTTHVSFTASESSIVRLSWIALSVN